MSDESPAEKQGHRRLKALLFLLAMIIFLCLVFIGPWYADNRSYQGQAYLSTAKDDLAAMTVIKQDVLPLEAAFAMVDISPAVDEPLAGYGKREPMFAEKIVSRCYAKALSFKRGDRMVTLLSLDMLTLLDDMRREIIRESGAGPADLYITASHTHGGPGGWVPGLVHEKILGPYDPAIRKKLIQKIAGVIKDSRKNFVPVSVALLQVDTKNKISNRIDKNMPTYERLNALFIKETQTDKAMVIWVSYGAHATLYRRQDRFVAADYPGALANVLKEKTDYPHVMFSAGAVGDAKPNAPAVDDRHLQVKNYADSLASDLLAETKDLQFKENAELQYGLLHLMMPKARIPLDENWALSPFLNKLVVDKRGSHISYLKIDRALFLGMPGDYAGELARELDDHAREQGDVLFLTSFNGDYKGYFVTKETWYNYDEYETRGMNFFGPAAGPYLNHLAIQIIDKLGQRK